LKAPPQIRETCSDPYPCSGPQLDHRSRLSSTARTSAASTPFSTLTRARPGNSMWIDPDGVIDGATSGAMTRFGSEVKVTGRSSVRRCLPAHEAPFRYSYLHWKTWLALTPFSRATRAIDAPATSVASTMRRFSSPVRCTRCAETLAGVPA
jgi:hypothetical protein